MELQAGAGFVQSYVLCVPNEYIYSLCSITKKREELANYSSNSVVINEVLAKKVGLTIMLRACGPLAVMKFKCGEDKSDNPIIIERLVQVLLDQHVAEDTIILSEELLFNLLEGSHECTTIKKLYLAIVKDQLQELIMPRRATKIVICSYQCDLNLDAAFVAELMEIYFSSKRLLSKGDIFSIAIDKHNVWVVNNRVNAGKLYFKVIDIESSSSDKAKVTNMYVVDTSVAIFEVSNCQGFLPSRRIFVTTNPRIESLLSNELLMKNVLSHNHYIVPASYNEILHKLCNFVKPFLFAPETVKGLCLSPTFLMTGSNGSGKSMLLEATCQLFGVRYLRVDCITIGGTVPGQSEAKLKIKFEQAKTIGPCLLHLSNIEALCEDADHKEDVRLMKYLEQQVSMLKSKWPVVIVASSRDVSSLSLNLRHLFLDEVSINNPNCEERESILTWLCHRSSEVINEGDELVKKVAAQTSGFGFRDLEVLFGLAYKERSKRLEDDTNGAAHFVIADFMQTIAVMHKAYSESIGAPKVPSVLWKDVGGLEHLKKEILRSLRSNMFSSGLKRSGLLLHGPPGTGKTLLGKAVATQCKRNFLSVKGPELLNMYVGQSEHNVRKLFELAKTASPCIVFFDELDSLAPNRGRSGDSGGVMDRVVSQLLAEMDDVSASNDVFILGATNRPDLIDPALLRPGRLDKLLFVGPCEDRNSQISVLTAITRKLTLGADVDLQEVVSLLPSSVTGAQLSAICSAAWLCSARHIINSGETESKVTVNRDHFISALSTALR